MRSRSLMYFSVLYSLCFLMHVAELSGEQIPFRPIQCWCSNLYLLVRYLVIVLDREFLLQNPWSDLQWYSVIPFILSLVVVRASCFYSISRFACCHLLLRSACSAPFYLVVTASPFSLLERRLCLGMIAVGMKPMRRTRSGPLVSTTLAQRLLVHSARLASCYNTPIDTHPSAIPSVLVLLHNWYFSWARDYFNCASELRVGFYPASSFEFQLLHFYFRHIQRFFKKPSPKIRRQCGYATQPA